jgi:hypothetical protein
VQCPTQGGYGQYQGGYDQGGDDGGYGGNGDPIQLPPGATWDDGQN